MFGDPFELTPAQIKVWCAHSDTITDDDGHPLCTRCCAVLPPQVLTEQLLWDAADAIWSRDYHGPGLPPSFRHRLEDS